MESVNLPGDRMRGVTGKQRVAGKTPKGQVFAAAISGMRDRWAQNLVEQ